MGLVLGVDDIDPDGVKVVIPWHHLRKGTSIFVPCINHKRAVSQFTKIANSKGKYCRHKILVENGLLGVRFWMTT